MPPIAHLCILDDDPAALATPLADAAVPGELAVLCGTQQQKALAGRLTAVLQPRGVRCEFRVYDPEADTLALLAFFGDLLAHLGGEGYEVWLNASTGPRPVTLAAYEAARSAGQCVFAVATGSDHLVWLHPPDGVTVPLADRLNLREYLLLYGATHLGSRNRGGVARELRNLGQAWADAARELGPALGTLNYLAAKARGTPPTSPPVAPAQRSDRELGRLVTDLAACALAEWLGDRVAFRDDEARFFANGGWLEELVFGTLRGLRSAFRQIQDDGHSVEVSRPVGSRSVRNELDVAFVANNKLHVIECKTKRFRDDGAVDVLYKLDSLKSLAGGLNARGMLVSYHSLSAPERLRAEDLGIRVVDRGGLGRLQEHLRDWVATA